MPDAPVDYRSLIHDRRTKQKRVTIRHIICLDPSLFAELEELVAEQAEDRYAEPEIAETKKKGDVRLGERSVATRITDLEAELARVSVVGVFKAPTADRQAQLSAQDYEDDNPFELLRAQILDAFTHFESSRDEVIPADQLGPADLAELLPELSQGELLALGNKIVNASAGAPDLPKSVRQSLLSRRSVGTSKPPSTSESRVNGSMAGSRAPATAMATTES